MLVMLIPDDVPEGGEGEEEERYVLLTVQPRVAAGSLEFVELPAGMVDEGGSFAGQAAREIWEELGMVIGEGELVSLSELAGGGGGGGKGGEGLAQGVYPSPGACDEYIPIYMHERRVPRAQLGEWTGKLTGLREDGERITLKLVRMRDLWKEGARDAKCLAAVALWEGLKREGKV
jgi:8-oxo-dGTP pyrophosphatase MutT (NUDIX family)